MSHNHNSKAANALIERPDRYDFRLCPACEGTPAKAHCYLCIDGFLPDPIALPGLAKCRCYAGHIWDPDSHPDEEEQYGLWIECPDCDGYGLIEDPGGNYPCPDCQGQGIREEENL